MRIFGAPWRSRLASTKKKISETSIKSFHEMKGDRDGKGVQQETAYSAFVVNDHMYPRPYIVFNPKDLIKT